MVSVQETEGDGRHAVEQLGEALRYKPGGRALDSQWGRLSL